VSNHPGPSPNPEAVFRKHLEAIEGPRYPHSLDQQQRTLEFIRAATRAGGPIVFRDPLMAPLLVRLEERLGIPKERILAIARLPDPRDIRRALKAQPQLPRLRLDKEKVYPRGGWIGAYLDFTLLSEQPLGWHFWVGLAVLGAACRRNLYMDLGFGDVLYPNTYVLLVGDSGLGKNQVINRGTRVLRRACQSDDVVTGCLSRGEDRRVEIINETTAEGLVMALQPGPVEIPGTGVMIERRESCGMLVNPEAATLVGKSRRELRSASSPT
jgi:hypothetical protein